MDSIVQAGKFLKEQLILVEPEIIRTVYPQLWGFEGKYHTVKSGLGFGVNNIVSTRIDSVGKAVNFGGKAIDIPLANFGIDSDSWKTIMGVLGAEWSWTELEQQKAAENSGTLGAVNVVQEYSNALERGIRQWVHERTLFGDPADNSFTGLFNNSDVETIVLTDNLYSLSPRDLHLYIKNIIKNFEKTSKLTASASDMLVNVDLFDNLTNPISQSAGGGGGEATPYELLTDSKKGVSLRQINRVNELTYASLVEYGRITASANQDMFMLYDNSAETLYKHFSGVYKTPAALKDDGMTYRTTGFAKTSEVVVKMPFRVRYYLYPKAA
jgi:hypothetical protein